MGGVPVAEEPVAAGWSLLLLLVVEGLQSLSAVLVLDVGEGGRVGYWLVLGARAGHFDGDVGSCLDSGRGWCGRSFIWAGGLGLGAVVVGVSMALPLALLVEGEELVSSGQGHGRRRLRGGARMLRRN